MVPVEAEKPERRNFYAYFATYSRIEAERRVQVTSEGVGKCLQVLVEEGDKVRQGDILAELDKEDALAQLQQAEVQVRQTRADYERAKQMLEDDIIAPVEYDKARFAYENALASEKIYRLQLENLTIRAPISGVVTSRSIQPGMLVSSGVPVFEIVDPESFVLHMDVDEKELPRLKIGQVAKGTVDALEGEEFQATVTRINPSVDPASGTVKVRLEIDPQVRAKLREAAFVRLQLILDSHQEALAVPKDAVIEDELGTYVFTAEKVDSGDNGPRWYARRVEIQEALEDSDYVEVLSGIDEDTLVITLGHKGLKPDAEVRLVTVDEELETFDAVPAEQALEAAKTKQEELKRRAEEKKREARAAP